MIGKIMELFFGTQQKKDLKKMVPLVNRINSLESEVMSWSGEKFLAKTQELKGRYAQGESLDAMLAEAFAMAREAARRILGERTFDVQIMGAIVLHEGGIMEMKTGEGKTLSSVCAVYLNALTAKGVHIVTVNDYLAERDTQWMGPVFNYLGISVGVILSRMDGPARKEAYGRDVTYGTNNEFGFDYLRDNMKWDNLGKVQRSHNFCIVDEIDSILIDEARTPLIISGAAEDDTATYYEVNRLAPLLQECDKDPETGDYPENPSGDYKVDEKGKRVTFTNQGMNQIEEVLTKKNLISGSLFDSENFEFIHYFSQSLKAPRLFRKDVDYVVADGKVQIVDEFTGRVLYGRRYSDGLHQAIEAKERIKIAQRNRTLATITFQNYFRMYEKLSGMTGTAETEAKEFAKIYELGVSVIPTNRPIIRSDSNDVIYLTEKDKLGAICDEIEQLHRKGQPILVGTVSIEKSEVLSRLLTQRGIRHEVLNAKNHAREALIIAEAGAKGSVTLATNMAGRGTDIKLGGNAEYRARKRSGSDAGDESFNGIYKKEMEKWERDYSEVKSLGGLHVLGTERHEARRIDNQLRGRSGRQGDPGSSQFFISLDDMLMRLFGGERLKSLMSRVGMREGDPIAHPLINKSIERAQKRVEERNFDIRKHLLDYDDVLNEQRNFIYTRREEILGDKALKDRVVATLKEILEDLVEEQEGDLSRLYAELEEQFFYSDGGGQESEAGATGSPATGAPAVRSPAAEPPTQHILEDFRKDLKEKESSLGKENFNSFVRFEYLRHIDSRWQDHLENLDALREAVYLRAYAQKNPLLEYKLEGFQIFDQMLLDIKTAIAKKVLKVKIQSFEGRKLILEREGVGNARHKVLGQFAAAGASSERPEARPASAQVRRSLPKVGRNEPCPCGSGKKYKYCHGR
jgi:preprotein translocase subunit SecA